MNRIVFQLICFFCLYHISDAQNLPSLLLNRNINSTFSILAYDKVQQEWGIAVATNNIYVGNSTIYIQPGVGAFSVIAETEPAYAINGFEQLKQGKTPEQAILYTVKKDELADFRQVSGMDAKGTVYAFTGSSLKYWKGFAGQLLGDNYVVVGNQLADSVLTDMASTFKKATGTLAERLLKSLVAGQKAGGQITGKQSAALVVKGLNNEWFNQIDLRVDNSKTPFEDLQRLLNYHDGRIKLNQAINALKNGNIESGKDLLTQAEVLTEGWNGIYDKVAKAYLLLGNEKKAVLIIQKAIEENPQWKKNLSVFYCLAKHPALSNLMKENSFTIKDWNAAISLLTEINRAKESIDLAIKVLKNYPTSSYTHYLLGEAYKQEGNKKLAKANLERALQLDSKNAEAERSLMNLSNNK